MARKTKYEAEIHKLTNFILKIFPDESGKCGSKSVIDVAMRLIAEYRQVRRQGLLACNECGKKLDPISREEVYGLCWKCDDKADREKHELKEKVRILEAQRNLLLDLLIELYVGERIKKPSGHGMKSIKCVACEKGGVHHEHFGLPFCRECRIEVIKGLVRPFLLAEKTEVTREEAERRIRAALERDRKTNKALDTVLRIVEAMRRTEEAGEKGEMIDFFA